MVKDKKNKPANALNQAKNLCKDFGCSAGISKDALPKARKKK